MTEHSSNAGGRGALYQRISRAIEHLTPEEHQAIRAWEKEHVSGSGEFATSDWRGWEGVFARLDI